VIAALTLGLALGYRRHRRLSNESLQQAEIQRFLKGLGPLDLTDQASTDALEHVRTLLHAERLSLTLRLEDDWVMFKTAEGTGIESSPAKAPTTTPAASVGPDDHMLSPLLHDGEFAGVLVAHERVGVRNFSMRDVRLIEIVASELAKAMDRGQLQRKLALAATTDPLTQLPNLNEISRRIDELVARGSTSLVLAAVAVDSFREVNDTLGHEVGDELLLEVTRRLKLSYPDALVGRIGGGRFAIAVEADQVGNDAAMFGLGLRAQVEGGAQLGPVGTHIRLSVGCVTAPEHGDDAATLIRRAETAMYGARNAHGGPVLWEPVYERRSPPVQLASHSSPSSPRAHFRCLASKPWRDGRILRLAPSRQPSSYPWPRLRV
jgi:diguanylate cyclase (GGDEF)-like protein